jgi:chorismate mutase / prephenate dehydratase
MDRAVADPLQEIRNRIDAIDEAMHRLLIDRSGVVAELIRIKGTSRPASAFRPDREADMMRRLALRHQGDLPLATVEHIWREIITTFTAMQAPFGVATAPAADPLAMRDLVRFYFGFSVPVTPCEDCAAAIARVSDPGTDVALVPAAAGGRWWRRLAGAAAPKVFARLPFIELPGRPAALPAYAIGLPLSNPSAPDIRLFACPRREAVEQAALDHGGRISGSADGEILVELPVAITPDELGLDQDEAQLVGGFAQPIIHLAERTA